MTSNRFFIICTILLVAGCGDKTDGDVPGEPQEASLPGVYSGVFPCEDCPGIDATLWLRADGRFFFRQRYPADETQVAVDAFSLGRWQTMGDAGTIELSGSGPLRTFMHPDPDTLLMQTDSELPHRLTRDPVYSEFSETIRMAGVMRTSSNGMTFTECLTGFEAPVSKGGDFARFRHQYRSVGGRNRPVYVELEGRFSWSRDGALESLRIVRFVTVREEKACEEKVR